MLIKERLKMCRKECKLTQQQVADLLQVDRSAYAYYELGVSSPSIENLFKLSAIFKVDADWLLGMEKNESGVNSPEGELVLLKAVKEKNITDLSKEERKFVSLYRIVSAKGKKDELLQIMQDVIVDESDE